MEPLPCHGRTWHDVMHVCVPEAIDMFAEGICTLAMRLRVCAHLAIARSAGGPVQPRVEGRA